VVLFIQDLAAVQGFPDQGIAFAITPLCVIRPPGQEVDGKIRVGPIENF
jgi:hypothetical protein